MKPIIPVSAKPGDYVYVISPSAGLLPFTKNRNKRAVENLEKLGLKVRFANNADKNDGYISASVEERVADIHQAFNDKDCSIIMASIGGNHSNQLLPFIDFELIRNNPKIFIGYSDNTILHYAFLTQSNLQSYYGPCFLNQFGENPEVLSYTLEYFSDVIFGIEDKPRIYPSKTWTNEVLDWFKNKDSERPRNMLKNDGFVWWREGKAEGLAIPGAIPSLNHLLGTKYFPKVSDRILMLDIPEGHNMLEGQPISEVDAWLTDLDNSGVLASLNAIVISRPYKYTKEMIKELKQVVMRLVGKYDYPVLFNADFGHTDPMITIPILGKIKLDSSYQSFSLSKK